MVVLLECRCRASSRSYQTVAPGRAATFKPTSFAWRECIGGSSGARAITPCRVVHGDDPRPSVLANVDVAFPSQAPEDFPNRRTRKAVALTQDHLIQILV